VTHSTA